MADATERHGKTLFVRNLPYTTTNESLEKEFSDIGPLKSCFVVKDKDSGKCRGFGYVKFTLLDDAEKALTSVKKVEGRNVHIVFANKKEKKKRFGQPQKLEQETSGAVENQQNGDNDVDKKNPRTTKPVLATVTKGRESDIGTAKSEKILPHSKQGKKEKEKKKIPVKGQKQAPNPLNEGKRARLIIRNLAFKCSKEELQQAFEKCGHVVDVHIPTKASGTRLGFGFVQFENKAQAGMAVAQLNGSSVAGRPVAVDWALPKNLYESRTPAKQTASGHEGSDSQEDMEVDGEKEKPKHSRSGGLPDINGRGAKSDRRDADDEDGEEGEEEEEEEEEEEDEDSDGDRVEEQMDDETDSGEAETSSDEDDHNHSDNRNHSGFGKDNKRGKHSTLMERSSDVGEGRTIFIRNLPFSTNEEEVKECFSPFGEVRYARIVKDGSSGMSKGTAFVQFVSKDGANASLQAAANENEGGIVLQGRQLIVSLAVTREQAGDMTRQKDEEKKKKNGEKKEEKDSRNLFLSREGMIRPGTEAAKDVSPGDMALRSKIAEANRQKLKDQNVFVSSTRLCVHNIPPTVNDAMLKKIVLKAAGDRNARLTECRIMRDLTRLNSQGQGKSKGFAFCTFTQHANALAALKKLNNCPTVFGDKKRPIVEFSLENRKALEAKQKRLEKSQVKTKRKSHGPEENLVQAPGQDQSQTANKKKRKRKSGKSSQDSLPLEVKKQQDKVARSMYKGPLGLPSHWGPKQRHKPRQPQQTVKKANQKAGLGGKRTKLGSKGDNQGAKPAKQKTVKMKNPNKKRTDIDGFDKLVASYKKKIMKSATL